MEEQATPAPEVRRSRLTSRIVLALAVILAAAAVYLLTARKGPAPVEMATMIPQNAVVAVTIDLSKTPEKQDALDVITGVVKDAGIADPEKWFHGLLSGGRIDVEKEILPKLSLTGAVAVLPEWAGMAMPAFACFIGAKSKADAAGLLDIIKSESGRGGPGFGKSTYKGNTYYTQSQGFVTMCLGCVKNAVVLTNSESAFKSVVDVSVGDSPNLAGEGNYRDLLEVKPSTFMTTYYSGLGYFELMKPMLAMASEEDRKMAEDWVTELEAAVGWADADMNGVEGTAVAVSKSAVTATDRASLDELASVAPRDAAFLLAIDGFEQAWADLKEKAFANESTKQQFEMLLQMAEFQLGFNPMTDVLDRITSISLYYVPRVPDSNTGMPGYVVAVIGVDKPGVVQGTLNKLRGMIGKSGAMLHDENAAGEKVTIAREIGKGVQLGYTLAGNKVIVAIGPDAKDALSAAIPLSRGKGSSAAEAGMFELLKKDLPAESSFLFYADVAPLLQLGRDEMSPDARRATSAIMKRVSAMAAATETSGNRTTLRFTLPFKK